MTLEQFLQTLKTRVRKFELHALVQQNAGAINIEQNEEPWEDEFCMFLVNSGVKECEHD
jgi:hypothetical protein